MNRTLKDIEILNKSWDAKVAVRKIIGNKYFTINKTILFVVVIAAAAFFVYQQYKLVNVQQSLEYVVRQECEETRTYVHQEVLYRSYSCGSRFYYYGSPKN